MDRKRFLLGVGKMDFCIEILVIQLLFKVTKKIPWEKKSNDRRLNIFIRQNEQLMDMFWLVLLKRTAFMRVLTWRISIPNTKMRHRENG